MVDFLLQAMFDDANGWAFLLPNLLCEAGDVEHPVRLNDDSKIEAPNAEDFFSRFWT